MNKIINGNVIRALHRIKSNPSDVDHLVEEEYKGDLIELLNAKQLPGDSTFDLKTEFATQYSKIKTAMDSMGQITTKEDLDILKEAQKFLSFIMRNEEKLADIEAVKQFKEAVLNVLDEESPELKDRVIRRLGEQA